MSSFAFVTNRGRLLLLLRDNKPTIPNPNKWSLLGGRDEADETPEETLFRELKEEANIEKAPVRFLWEEESEQNGVKEGRKRYYYHLPLPNEQLTTLKLGDEGQALSFFTLEELKKIPLTWRMTQLVKESQDILVELIT